MCQTQLKLSRKLNECKPLIDGMRTIVKSFVANGYALKGGAA